MQQRIVHFEILAEHPERATAFYTEVFGWKAQKWEGPADYWLLTTGEAVTAGEAGEPGINGGIGRAGDMNLPACTVNTIAVPSVEAFCEKIAAHGGKVVMPKMEVPGVGYLAYCRDTEGVTFGIMEFAAPSGA
jgi:predicted enzyme related to lactoylglutathione lyase